MAASIAARHSLADVVHLSLCYADDDLVEISSRVRSTCNAEDEVHALLDRFDAGVGSIL